MVLKDMQAETVESLRQAIELHYNGLEQHLALLEDEPGTKDALVTLMVLGEHIEGLFNPKPTPRRARRQPHAQEDAAHESR